MKISKTSIAFLAFFNIVLFSFPAVPLLHAGHGCPQNEPDRDGDGIPDKQDAYPDDPTRGGETEPQLKLSLVPFASQFTRPVTADDIETKSDYSIWIFENQTVIERFKGFFEDAVNEEGITLAASDIRLKIEFPKDNVTILADKNGNATKSEGLADVISFKLSEATIKELESAVQEFQGILDMKAHEKLAKAEANPEKLPSGDEKQVNSPAAGEKP